MLRFVYQVVVHKSFAPKDLVKVLESGDPVVLPAWDPMVRWYHVFASRLPLMVVVQGALA